MAPLLPCSCEFPVVGNHPMRKSEHALAVAVTMWSIVAGISAQPGRAPQITPGIDFTRDVRPILETRCLECHDQNRRKGGLSLATYGDALEGGRNGAVVRPGNGAGSLLVHRIAGAVEPQMPKDEEPLTAAQIAVIRRWIDEGARETPASPPAPAPWDAPLELTRPDVPASRWKEWSSPIDRLVAAVSDKPCWATSRKALPLSVSKWMMPTWAWIAFMTRANERAMVVCKSLGSLATYRMS